MTSHFQSSRHGEETTSPSNTMGSKNPSDNFSLALDSSEDEAPEEVTFEDSRAQALRSMKQALDIARREKLLLKERRRRRRRRLELFEEQKKRKRLPADVLEEIDSAASQKQDESHQGEDLAQSDEKEEEEETKKRKKNPHSRNLKGNYTVTTVKERPLTSVQQQAAEDFIRSRLYGPRSCRTTNNELLSLQKKTGRNKGAAVQFVQEQWAVKEKAKAEKLKKRWVHKQQTPSC